jgi:trk system potassium uptake protein TrkA
MTKPKGTFSVLGLSRFGYRTATGLFEGGASVIAVDRDALLVQRIAQHVTRAVQADAMDMDVMDHVGAFEVDTVVIGFRSAFDATVLLAHHLRTRTRVARIVAQVDGDLKAESLKRLGVDHVVFPERDIADRVVRRLLVPDLVEHIPLSPQAGILEVPVPASFVGRSIREMEIRSRYHVSVIGLKRREDERGPSRVRLAPPPDEVFRTGDVLLVLGTTEDLALFTRKAIEG